MRKNLRGFTSHVWAIAERLMADEFPVIGKKISRGEGCFVYKCMVGFYPYGYLNNCLAMAEEFSGVDGEAIWSIRLNLDERDFWLKATDEELIDILRHEFLHDELAERGRPNLDCDIEFIKESLKRGIVLERRHFLYVFSYLIGPGKQLSPSKFEPAFNYCFPEGLEYWAKFLKGG